MKPYTLVSVVVLLATISAGACSKTPEQRKQAYLASAKRYVSQQKYGEAIVEFRNAVHIDPLFGEAHEGLSEALAAQGDVGAAARELVQAADLTPASAGLQLKAGTVLLLAGRYDDARVRADKVLASDARNVTAQILKANALAGLKDFQSALIEINQAIAIDPSRSTSFSALGALRVARGEAAEAEAAFLHAVELDPQSVNARLALGNFYWMNGGAAEAEAAFKHALGLEPANALASRALATYYLASKRPDEAEPFLVSLARNAQEASPKFDLADYYASLARYQDALKTLEPLADHPTRGTDAQLRIAVVKHLQGDRPGAHKLVDEILQKNGKHNAALLTKARLLFAEGNTADAIVPATSVVANDPASVRAHYLLGTIHASLRHSVEAKQEFTKVLELNPRAVAASVQLAQLELASGDFAASKALAEGAITREPGNASARLILAKNYIAANNLDGADRELSLLAKAYPNWAAVRTNLGMMHARRQNETAAREAFEAAVRLDPRAFEPFAGLVALDIRKGDFAGARNRIEAKLAQNPSDTAAQVLASRAYLTMKDVGRSEQILKSVLHRDPANLEAYGDLARLYLRSGRLDEARVAFETVANRQPSSVVAQTMVGVILEAQNRPAEAVSYYKKAVGAGTNSAVAANNLAWLYAERAENLQTALELAKSAKQALPDRAEVSDTLGFVYLRKNVPDLAVNPLREAVKQDPANPRYRLRLGTALARSGRVDEARREIAPLLSTHPDLPEAAEARAAIAQLR
jgi:tetratricopeptide (TPR) repeat protein